MSTLPEGSETQKSVVEVNSQSCWEEAQRIAALTGIGPNAFTTCIRFLQRDGLQAGPGRRAELSKAARYCSLTLLKSNNVKSALYFAALTFRPSELARYDQLTGSDFLELFAPDELANLLAVLFLFRRVQRGCGTESFTPLAQSVHTWAEIGGHLGQAIPEIGLGRGVLIGAIRHLASAMFLGIDEKNFIKLQRSLRHKNLFFDPLSEVTLWGCSHIHIASSLMQTLGLGVPDASALAHGLMPSTQSYELLPPDAYRYRIATVWLESLFTTGEPPDIRHRGDYYPVAAKLKTLLDATHRLREEGSTQLWLSRNKKDISPDKTPQLFTRAGGTPRTERPPEDLSPEDLTTLLQQGDDE